MRPGCAHVRPSPSARAVWRLRLWRGSRQGGPPTGASPYTRGVPPKVPIDEEASRGWVEVAHGARTLQHCLRHAGDPRSGSSFAQVGELYPLEKVSDRVRAYLAAAIEHLIFWADVQAPLKFHPEQSVEVTLRPSYTLARACLESAAQAVWLMDTTDPMECIRRHICLMRWDLHELRKSWLEPAAKSEAQRREADLVHRVSEVFSEAQVRAPRGYLEVIRSACAADGLSLAPDDAERIWRAASGAAHGKFWPTLELQQVIPIEEYEPRQYRSMLVPDVGGITEALRAAHAMAEIGVLRYLDYSGLDIQASLAAAQAWLSEVIPLKEGADREELRRRWSQSPPSADT